MKTAKQRAALLAPVFGTKKSTLLDWLRTELGSADALDRWVPNAPGLASRAVAPRTLYHLCPGNVPDAGRESLLIGLLLGSHNIAKLPRDPVIRRSLRALAASLPGPLQPLLTLRSAFRPADVARADAVIAYGGDEAVAALRLHLRPGQTFLAYGHRVSFLWLGLLRAEDRDFRALAAAAARDVAAHRQLGCLSPQAVYLAPGSDTVAFGAALAEALEKELPARLPPIPLPDAAAIRHARHSVRAAGGQVIESTRGLRWTVLLDPRPAFRDGFAHGTIPVRVASPDQLKTALRPFLGKISTVGLRYPLSRRDEALCLDLGAERLCPVGQCQSPPLLRHHDGRTRLAHLVKWVDREAIQAR